MNKLVLVLAYLVLHISVFSQAEDNTLTPEEFAAGWELLFDGETLNGWKAYNGEAPKTWKVKENAIYCTGEKGGDDLMTVQSVEDFDLKFQWKIEEKGNSGVIYRAREGKQWTYPHITGLEYQVLDDPNYSSLKYNQSTGSLYDMYEPSKDKKLNPAMEWNTGRIRISNNLVTHWVNGQIVMQCQLYSDDWNLRVANSKWKNNPYFGKSPFGHITFQNHWSQVWYKNVKIRRL